VTGLRATLDARLNCQKKRVQTGKLFVIPIEVKPDPMVQTFEPIKKMTERSFSEKQDIV
jgi:hypothetical protein